MFKKFLCFLAVIIIGLSLVSNAQAQNRGVYYEIFIRAFADSDGDGIGDIQGLISKLDYIENLGVKGLWLMPIFPSPTYHGYDITDYRAINPQYGTMEDFEQLLEEAHKRDISILLDIAFNHTSTQHPWFREAVNKNSSYHDWYVWSDNPNVNADLKLEVWGHKVWNRLGNRSYYAIFWDGMPDLNFENYAVRKEVIDISKFWLDKGVDGFRLDATSHIYGQGEYSPFQDTAKAALWWQEYYNSIKADYPDCYIVGEAWEDLNKRSQLMVGMDSCFNFDVGTYVTSMLKLGGSGKSYIDNLSKIYKAYQNTNPNYIDAPFLSNHDQNRIYASVGYKLDKAKMAANILLTLPGNPFIYYGEEIGMAGAKPDEELRTPMLWGNNDKAQTNWHSSKYNKKTLSQYEQSLDENSLYNHYLKLIQFRNSQKALTYGQLNYLDLGNDKILSYTMRFEDEELIVIHNYTKSPQSVNLQGKNLVFSTGDISQTDTQITLDSYQSAIFK